MASQTNPLEAIFAFHRQELPLALLMFGPKAFIDMSVQRFGQAVAVVVGLGITTWLGDFSSVRRPTSP